MRTKRLRKKRNFNVFKSLGRRDDYESDYAFNHSFDKINTIYSVI